MSYGFAAAFMFVCFVLSLHLTQDYFKLARQTSKVLKQREVTTSKLRESGLENLAQEVESITLSSTPKSQRIRGALWGIAAIINLTFAGLMFWLHSVSIA